jgi:pyrroloquinoline quinone (PQQ) biosynthesis protein C
MQQCGADTSKIENFITVLKNTGDFNSAFTTSEIPKEARDFVDFTFKIIASNKDYLQSTIFTFGREDLIPGMFLSIVNDIHKKFPDSISIFKYYLERHIEVDGDHHRHLAVQMTSNLCGTDQRFWKEAEQATIESLQKRIDLWDGAYRQIINGTTTANRTMPKAAEVVLKQ